jgi:hypothetical protein
MCCLLDKPLRRFKNINREIMTRKCTHWEDSPGIRHAKFNNVGMSTLAFS